MRWYERFAIVLAVLGFIGIVAGSVGAQPIAFVVGIGQGANIATVTASGALKVDGTGGTFTLPSTDPCESSGVAKSSVVLNTSTATTTLLVALASSKVIFVCGYDASMGGTSPTAKFVYGTQVTNPCDTGQTALTGTYLISVGNELSAGQAGQTVFATAASQQLCLVTTGTNPSVQGVLTYVQQ